MRVALAVIVGEQSHSAAHHFGAPSAGGLAESTVYQLSALALSDVSGLTVTVTKKTGTVLDDGFGVGRRSRAAGRPSSRTPPARPVS